MKTSYLCNAIVLVLLCPIATAQWVQTNGPNGGDIRCFAVAPAAGDSGRTLLAGTYSSGVFRSSDGGTRWSAANAGLTCHCVNALLAGSSDGASGSTLFAGTSRGIFRSTDRGKTWSGTRSESADPDVRSLVPFGTSLFAGTWGGGILRSTDNGETWTDAGLAGACITSFAVRGKTLFAGRLGLGGG